MIDIFITLAVVARVSMVVVDHDDMYPDTIKIYCSHALKSRGSYVN